MERPAPAATLRLPASVRAAALEAVGGKRISGELAWLTWAGTVWRLAGETGAVFVKRAAHLDGERDRLGWLAGHWPVPPLVGFFHALGDDWLLTREVPGVPLYHRTAGGDPLEKARLLGEILRRLHATDTWTLPFGRPRPGHVLVHGDFCMPNVLVADGNLSGVLDVGRAGLGSPEIDLAAGVWSLQYNFGKGLAGGFLAAYGWPPMTDQANERLRRRYGR
ncbi:MAG: phosphotransferase [Candidatus Dormibacterales bacterium]